MEEEEEEEDEDEEEEGRIYGHENWLKQQVREIKPIRFETSNRKRKTKADEWESAKVESIRD